MVGELRVHEHGIAAACDRADDIALWPWTGARTADVIGLVAVRRTAELLVVGVRARIASRWPAPGS